MLLALLENQLTERHARALLKLEREEDKLVAIGVMARQSMTAAAAERYIESLLNPRKAESPRPKLGPLLHSLDHTLDRLRQCGIPAVSERRETDAQIVLTITIPK